MEGEKFLAFFSCPTSFLPTSWTAPLFRPTLQHFLSMNMDFPSGLIALSKDSMSFSFLFFQTIFMIFSILRRFTIGAYIDSLSLSISPSLHLSLYPHPPSFLFLFLFFFFGWQSLPKSLSRISSIAESVLTRLYMKKPPQSRLLPPQLTGASTPKSWSTRRKTKRQRASTSQEMSVRKNTAKPVIRSAWLTSHPQAYLTEKAFPGSGDESRRASRSGSLVVDFMSQSILRYPISAPNILFNMMELIQCLPRLVV